MIYNNAELQRQIMAQKSASTSFLVPGYGGDYSCIVDYYVWYDVNTNDMLITKVRVNFEEASWYWGTQEPPEELIRFSIVGPDGLDYALCDDATGLNIGDRGCISADPSDACIDAYDLIINKSFAKQPDGTVVLKPRVIYRDQNAIYHTQDDVIILR